MTPRHLCWAGLAYVVAACAALSPEQPSELLADAAANDAQADASAADRDAQWERLPFERSPPIRRQLLLDRATEHVRLADARSLLGAEGSGRGQGVLVGIVDSGIDVTHPDLREADGTSRMAWWIDFGASPFGLYPELESEYGCDNDDSPCGILGPPELNRLAAGAEVFSSEQQRLTLPRDTLGHGTHVASLALGNGQSNPRYEGLAPEATLIGARVATSGVEVEDAAVLTASRFVFERATAMGAPAVVNLSLGGDIGPHDGSSGIERGLEALLAEPGRAIVVAAGNSGSLTPSDGTYPTPLGVHTEVHVPASSRVRVPILIPEQGALRGAVLVWIESSPSRNLAVTVEERDGTPILGPVHHGQAFRAGNVSLIVSVVHHRALDSAFSDTERGILIVLEGELSGGSVYSLVLEGESSANLWLQSEGDLGPGNGTAGALFPRALRERTVAIPAASSRLIAVGATLNRDEWPSYATTSDLQAFNSQLEPTLGSSLFFSAAGPNSDGVMKPDLVAPGGVVVGAMAYGAEATTDGRINFNSIFGPSPLCARIGCAEVDKNHGATLGTSMAAPLVSGAVALLFEQDPRLTQDELLALLQAGTTDNALPSSQGGAGLLNVHTTLSLLLRQTEPRAAPQPSTKHSRISFANTYARPGAEQPLQAFVHLRDANDLPADVEERELSVSVDHGTGTLTRRGPGFYALELFASRGTGGERLGVAVLHGQHPLLKGWRPIAVDAHAAEATVSVRGGCLVVANAERHSHRWWHVLVAAGALLCWRRQTSGPLGGVVAQSVVK